MRLRSLGAWLASGLIAGACSLNPQPEPPAASETSGDFPRDASPPAFGGGAVGTAGGTGGTPLSGAGGAGASFPTGTGGTTAGLGGLGPQVADGGGLICPACEAADGGLDGGADAAPQTGGADGG